MNLAHAISALAFAYPEHLSPTYGTHTLGCWLTVFHGDALGVFHFSFSATFNTIRLHFSTPLFILKLKLFALTMSRA